MKIGVTFSETNFQNYPKWVKGGDKNIEIIVLTYQENNLEDVSNCDAIVFTGGIDMEPTEKIEYENAPSAFNIARDQFEIEVLKLSLEQKKPILGICRGLQLINTYKGGTLHLDNGKIQNEIHKKEEFDKIHPIQVAADSLFYTIVHQIKGEVNSAHHQSIDKLGADLKATAFSEDGVIEVIESSDPEKQFILGVQWHPERMNDLENPFSKNIRTALINTICN
jgi:putative glutamine amidotransferase